MCGVGWTSTSSYASETSGWLLRQDSSLQGEVSSFFETDADNFDVYMTLVGGLSQVALTVTLSDPSVQRQVIEVAGELLVFGTGRLPLAHLLMTDKAGFDTWSCGGSAHPCPGFHLLQPLVQSLQQTAQHSLLVWS